MSATSSAALLAERISMARTADWRMRDRSLGLAITIAPSLAAGRPRQTSHGDAEAAAMSAITDESFRLNAAASASASAPASELGSAPALASASAGGDSSPPMEMSS